MLAAAATFIVTFPRPTSVQLFRTDSGLGPELAEALQVDVPFLLQQAQMLYEKQLEEVQLQMKRVHSSTSLTQSKGNELLYTVLIL